jgi:hypothetical protein
MRSLNHCGETFDERTDWIGYLRNAAVDEYSVRGLRDDLSLRSGLGELYEALQGTPMQAAMASAAVFLLEMGTPEERHLMFAIPFEEAPGAKKRLLKLLEQSRVRLTASDITGILHRLLEENLGDPEVTSMLQRELERPDSKVKDLGLAARHLPDWFIPNLPLLRPPPPVDGGELTCWLARIPEGKRQPFLDSVVALGKLYVDALIADQLAPSTPEAVRQRDRPVLEAHPVFRQALAEALKSSSS